MKNLLRVVWLGTSWGGCVVRSLEASLVGEPAGTKEPRFQTKRSSEGGRGELSSWPECS